MTTYTDHADALFDPGKPILGSTGLESRDNAIAIADGGDNAPVLAAGWHPYDKVKVGDGNDGVIWSFAVDGAASAIVSPVFEDGYEYGFILDNILFNGAFDFRIDLRKAVDSAYQTAVTIGVGPVGYCGMAYAAMPRLEKYTHSVIWVTSFSDSNATSVNAGAGGEFTDSTFQSIDRMRISLSSGQMVGGAVRFVRRREFITG